MTDLAKRANTSVNTFQNWFTVEDWVTLIQLGWRPNKRLLTPPVVKYIIDKYLPEYEKR